MNLFPEPRCYNISGFWSCSFQLLEDPQQLGCTDKARGAYLVSSFSSEEIICAFYQGEEVGIVKSDPSPATWWPGGNWFPTAFQPCCVIGAAGLIFQGILQLLQDFKAIPTLLVYHFYWNKLKMRLSGAYNNCEIFLLEICVSHLFGKIFSSIIHYRGLKIILQWQSLYLFLDNWHPLLADLECFFDDNACDPAGFAEWLHKQRQIVKCGKEKAIFIILETVQPAPGPILNVISVTLHFS